VTNEAARKIKRIGRPSTGLDIQMMLRVSADFLRSVDEWREKQPSRPPRAVAIRALVEIGLAAAAAVNPHGRKKPADEAGKNARTSKPKKATGALPAKKARQRRP
jgi:hypothetical protein